MWEGRKDEKREADLKLERKAAMEKKKEQERKNAG